MAISEKDQAFMAQVAAYYRRSAEGTAKEGSINDTAIHFGLSRNKIRKILITTGDLASPLTEEATLLRAQGLNTKAIAAELGVSEATVSTALPYEDKVGNSLEPSAHAASVREYRAYEREQAKRQVARRLADGQPAIQKKGDDDMEEKAWIKDIKMSYTENYHRPHRDTWEDVEKLRAELGTGTTDADSGQLRDLQTALERKRENDLREEQELASLEGIAEPSEADRQRIAKLRRKLGQFPGALNSRHRPALEAIAGTRLPPEPMSVTRLHLEFYAPHISEEAENSLKKYANLKHGDAISRDIVVPYDMPLYALHYVIQRAFGWQNSHLYEFLLPDERNVEITHDNAAMWSCMVGLLYQSPLMDDEEELWADDYRSGSFKNWLRKKYTGPYMSQCRGEGIISCQEDMMSLDMQEWYYVLYEKQYNPATKQHDGDEFIGDVRPVYDGKGKKQPAPTPFGGKDVPSRVEIRKFEAIPAAGLSRLFDRNPFALLKRLPLFAVLSPGMDALPDSPEERDYVDGNIAHTGNDIYLPVEKYIHNVIEEQIDSPLAQVVPPAFTDVLFYHYDFGDSWTVRITASENCPDLVESGRITQSDLDRANVKCREVYRPVLLARDGSMLMDDVGGIEGYADFLQSIHPDTSLLEDVDAVEEARSRRKESLDWAKSMGWKKEDVSTNLNLL